MQVSYAEPLALLLVVLCLVALHHGHHRALIVCIVLLALTRALAAPMALTVMVTIGLRAWRDADSRRNPRMWGVACVAAVSPAIWPVSSWVMTGRPRAYFEAIGHWYTPGADGWLSPHHPWALPLLAGLLILFAILLQPRWAAWGDALRVWAVAYLAYVFTVTVPAMHLLRYLLLTLVPAIPAAALVRSTRSWSIAACLLAMAGIAAQYWWITHVFVIWAGPARQPFP